MIRCGAAQYFVSSSATSDSEHTQQFGVDYTLLHVKNSYTSVGSTRMEGNDGVAVKTWGHPKGRKDGWHREGAPKCGRPKKKLNNGGNNEVMHDDTVDGAYGRFKLTQGPYVFWSPQRVMRMNTSMHGTRTNLLMNYYMKLWSWRIVHWVTC